MLKVGRALRPAHVVCLGDLVNCDTVSSYARHPLGVSQMEDEFDSANKALDQLDQLTGKKYLAAGNHEQRVDDYLCKRAPELYSLIKVERLLRLRERGWSYTPYRSFLKLGKLHICHDTGNAGAQAHLKAMASFEGSVAIGHTHRLAVGYSGSAKGASHVGAMLGWLGDVSQISYAHRIQAMRDWQLGFGVAYLERATGHVHIQPVPLVGYRCVVGGKLFVG
jgi:hypothetical protein